MPYAGATAQQRPSLSGKVTFEISARWSSLVARWAHNPKVVSSNLARATKTKASARIHVLRLFVWRVQHASRSVSTLHGSNGSTADC